ncbi:MAG: tetratricopeptide repeat protein [Leptospiraceae bacterium]|nr:tetratricopeptide repeat protein [Leptospiraceae bacterium]
MALRLQAETIRNPEERKDLNTRAIQYFDEYINCLTKQNYSVSGLTYYQKAISQFEINDPKAEESIELALKEDSRLREAIVLRARLFIKKKEYNEAQNLLEEAISYFSDDSDILYILGSLNIELGNDSKALLYFGSLWNNIQKKEGDPRYTANVLKIIAELLSKKIELDRTIRYRTVYYLKTYLKYKPSDKEAKFVLALMLTYSGKMNEARDVLIEIIDSNPNRYSQAMEYLAEIYYMTNKAEAYKYFKYLEDKKWIRPNSHISNLNLILKGRFEEAKPLLEKTSAKYKNRLSLYLALIEIYKKTGETDNLINAYLNAAKLSFAYRENLRAVSLTKDLIKLRETKELGLEHLPAEYDFIASCYEDINANNLALIYVREAVKKADNEKQIHFYKIHEANILRTAGLKRYEDSIKILKDISNKRPEVAGVYFALGLNYYLLGRYRESVDYYSWAIDLEPKNSSYYYYRASSYEKLGYIEETRKDLLRSIDLEPNSAIAHNFLGYLYAEKEIELDESLKLIRKAIDLEPDNAAYQDSLGWVMYRLGKYEESIHHLQLAKQLMEEKEEVDGVIYDHLGDVYFKMNDIPSARENWEKAEKLIEEKDEKKKVAEKLKKLDNLSKGKK